MSEAKRKALRYAVVMAFVAYVVVTVATLWFSNYAVSQNNRRFCAVLDAVRIPAPTPPDSAPSTTYGRDIKDYQAAVAARAATIRATFDDLAVQYRCDQQ